MTVEKVKYGEYSTSWRYVAFIDILGFAKMVERLPKDEDQDQLLQKIVGALGRMALFGHGPSSQMGFVRCTSFSDSVVVSTPTGHGPMMILATCAMLCTDLLRRGVLTRGGIALGRLYHETGTLFGEGMISAYRLEQTVARYPRIVLSEEVADEAIFNADRDVQNFVRRDFDHVPHLHYFHPFFVNEWCPNKESALADLAAARSEIAISLRSGERDAGIRAKQRWLANYFNASCSELGLAPVELD